MRKKLIITISIAFIGFLSYRLLFCYNLIPFGNSAGKKHKVYSVFYFPTAILNPFKTGFLRKKIINYCKSDDFTDDANSFKELHNGTFKVFNATYVKTYQLEVQDGNFELVSIKKENDGFHILTRQLKKKDATLVFIMKNDTVNSFY